MARTIALYALALALAAFALQWLEHRALVRAFPLQGYIALIGVAFAGLGLYVGWRLAARPSGQGFARNDAALRSLGITERERAVLDLLAAGQSNKEIARALGVSPNTVKTHIARLYEKLDVQRRTQAVSRARDLALIP
ncbi:MAG: response regulator transcription factor [Hydrogenophilaceae bacterium]|jgi:DNA-binding CsgD family transcriptional regulator|nr:response regulator transcription factor [Hydrogenophilaceae bacterium]